MGLSSLGGIGKAASIGTDLVGGAIGARASKKAAKAKKQAAKQQLALQRQNYFTTLGMNDPYYVTGTGANNLLAQMWGLPYQDVRSGAEIAKSYDQGSGLGASFGAKDIVKMLRSGMSVEDVAKMGTLKAGKTAKRINYLSEYGLNPEQIKALQQGPVGQVPIPEMQNAPGAAGGPAPNFDAFYNTPGYQYTRDQALGAVENSAAARGGLYSGNNMQDIAREGAGLGANQFWNTQNFLRSLSTGGQDAAGQNQQAGQFYTGGAGDAYGAYGDAKAAGILGQAASWQNALGSAAQMFGARESGVSGQSGGGAQNYGQVPDLSTYQYPSISDEIRKRYPQYGG